MNGSNTIALSRETAIPHLAPLPVPMMLHLAAHQTKGHRQESVALTLDDELDQATRNFHSTWFQLEQVVQEKRALAYTLLSGVVDTAQFSTSWVQATLASTNHAVTIPTISRWREHGLLRYEEWNRPAPDSVASLLIARMVDSRERGWLPPEIAQEEPYWWCWRQDGPEAPAVPCPIPLPEDLPPAALLWTPWAGAAWNPAWLNVGSVGAIRWAGTTIQHGKVLWSITEENLQRWDPGVFPLAKGVPWERAREVLHTIATMALLRLANTRLGHFPSGFHLEHNDPYSTRQRGRQHSAE